MRGALEALTSQVENLKGDYRLLILSSPQQLEDLNHLRNQRIAILPHPLSQSRLEEALEQLYKDPRDAKTSTPIHQQVPQNTQPRILAVDDNEPNLKLLKILLTDMGIQVDTASSGRKALQMVQDVSYNMVFMDIQMPEMDGLEVTSLIRAQEDEGTHMPIIALTAHAMAEEKAELITAGMDDYLTKPVNEQQLTHIITLWAKASPDYSSREQNKQITKAEKLPPVDRQKSIELAGGRTELAEELLSMLLDSLEQSKKEIIRSNRKKSPTTLLETVHKLHGASRYCGVPDLRRACHQLEVTLKAQPDSAERISRYIHELIEEIDRLLVWQEDHRPVNTLES